MLYDVMTTVIISEPAGRVKQESPKDSTRAASATRWGFKPGARIDFDLDHHAVEADHGAGIDAREPGGLLGFVPVRMEMRFPMLA